VVIWIAAILMITAVALFVAAPLSDQQSDAAQLATGAEVVGYEHEHALAVQALRELEFDHAMGKVEGDDYRALRHRLEIRALAAVPALNRIADSASPDCRAEAGPSLESSTIARAATMNFCYQCGAPFEQALDSCPNCRAVSAVMAPV
jgi:cytochrome c-type biogenesis protein CcmI